MSDPSPHNPSASQPIQPAADLRGAAHLFTLRLWQVELGDDRREWRGRLHHVGHDDIAHFRGWAALLPLLLAMLRRAGVTISVEHDV